MCHLTVLDLSGNQLTMVHGVHHLKCLMELILDNNVFSRLQVELVNLSKLRLLSVKNNSILEEPVMEDFTILTC